METIQLQRKKVYDVLHRLIHGSIGLAIIMLLSTAWISELFEKGPGEKAVWMLHIYAGYALVAAIVARVAWGLIGPQHARFTDLWHPKAWLHPLKFIQRGVAKQFGHDPLASAAYLALYGMLAVMAVTGLGLAAMEFGVGPLTPWLFDKTALEEIFEAPHEALGFAVMAFIALHIGAIVFHERKDGIPIAQEMVSGYQYRPAEKQKGESLDEK